MKITVQVRQEDGSFGPLEWDAKSVVGGLAVMRTVSTDQTPGTTWSVTQVCSGLTAVTHVSLKTAYAVRKALLAIPGADWNRSDILQNERIRREAVETVRLISY